MWRGAVQSAISGKRGQAFLHEMGAAMDAMEDKMLIHGQLVNAKGDSCAIGTVCAARGLDVSEVDPHAPEQVGKAVGIARAMAAEIEYINDECGPWSLREPEPHHIGGECPYKRWERVRKWIDEQIEIPVMVATV